MIPRLVCRADSIQCHVTCHILTVETTVEEITGEGGIQNITYQGEQTRWIKINEEIERS